MACGLQLRRKRIGLAGKKERCGNFAIEQKLKT
jgi:hypothetical protein